MEKIKGLSITDSTRAQFGNSVTPQGLKILAKQPTLQVLQCSEPVKESVWTLLNNEFFAKRPDVTLRVYGFYGHECDLVFARKMVNVRHFSVDCIMHATNVEAIADIPNLESLDVGIFELKGGFNFEARRGWLKRHRR